MLEGQLGKLLQQAQKMQSEMNRVQENLKNQRVEAVVDSGSVKVVVNGKQEIVDIILDKAIIHPANAKVIQELVITAVNQALTKSRDLANKEMSKVTGGLNLPNIPGLL